MLEYNLCLVYMAALSMVVYTVVFVRHGESESTRRNLFCGWYDSDLSAKGESDAKNAGQILKDHGYTFDMAFTSVLKRSVKTLYIIQEAMNLHWIPVTRHWRLNGRHHGAMQGLNKSDAAAIFGNERVQVWRRSYDTRPPSLCISDERWQGTDRCYAKLDKSVVPTCECLKDTAERVMPYWHDVIGPAIKSGHRLLISTHGSVVRSLIKKLENIPDTDIPQLHMFSSGVPIVYQLNEHLQPLRRFTLSEDKK